MRKSNYQKKARRRVKGKQSPKEQCEKHDWRKRKIKVPRGKNKGMEVAAWVCRNCNRTHNVTDHGYDAKRKFSVTRCTVLGQACVYVPGSPTCTVCEHKPDKKTAT